MCIERVRLYRTVNTLPPGFRIQSFNVALNKFDKKNTRKWNQYIQWSLRKCNCGYLQKWKLNGLSEVNICFQKLAFLVEELILRVSQWQELHWEIIMDIVVVNWNI